MSPTGRTIFFALLSSLLLCSLLHAKPTNRRDTHARSDSSHSVSSTSSSSLDHSGDDADDSVSTTAAVSSTGGGQVMLAVGGALGAQDPQSVPGQADEPAGGGGGGGGDGANAMLHQSALAHQAQTAAAPAVAGSSSSVSSSSMDEASASGSGSGDEGVSTTAQAQTRAQLTFRSPPEPEPSPETPSESEPQVDTEPPVVTTEAPTDPVTSCVLVQTCNDTAHRLYPESESTDIQVNAYYDSLINFLTQTNSRGSLSDTVAETIGEVNGERVVDCSSCVQLSDTEILCGYAGSASSLLLDVEDATSRPLRVMSAVYRTGPIAPFGDIQVLYAPVTFTNDDFLTSVPMRSVRPQGSSVFVSFPFMTQVGWQRSKG